MKPRVMESNNNLRFALLMSLEMNLTLILEIQIGCMFNLKLVNIHGTISSSILENNVPQLFTFVKYSNLKELAETKFESRAFILF